MQLKINYRARLYNVRFILWRDTLTARVMREASTPACGIHMRGIRMIVDLTQLWTMRVNIFYLRVHVGGQSPLRRMWISSE